MPGFTSLPVPLRSLAAIVVAAHVWASAVPCGPDVAAEAVRASARSSRAASPGHAASAHAPAATRGGSHSGHAAHESPTASDTHSHHAAPSAHAGHGQHPPGHKNHRNLADNATRKRPTQHAGPAVRGAREASQSKASELQAAERPPRFFTPVCPCGCDKRAPAAGASSARIGVAVPPLMERTDPVPARIVASAWRTPRLRDVTPARPDPVPRLRSIG